MQKKASDYKADLLADLRSHEYAAGYISAAAHESPEALLLALRDVAEAQKGMTRAASEAGLNRENLYRMLSEKGNPRLSSLYAVLPVLGYKIDIVPIRQHVTASGGPKEQARAQVLSTSRRSFGGSSSKGRKVVVATAGIGKSLLMIGNSIQGALERGGLAPYSKMLATSTVGGTKALVTDSAVPESVRWNLHDVDTAPSAQPHVVTQTPKVNLSLLVASQYGRQALTQEYRKDL